MKTQKELRGEFEKFIIEITDESRWVGGKPVYGGYKYVTLSNAIWSWIEKALQSREEEMKGIVKKSKPVFFIGKGMTEGTARAVSDAIHETKVQIYEDLFERKEK